MYNVHIICQNTLHICKVTLTTSTHILYILYTQLKTLLVSPELMILTMTRYSLLHHSFNSKQVIKSMQIIFFFLNTYILTG